MQVMVGLDNINRYFASIVHLDHQTRYRTVDYLTSLNGSNINRFKFSPVASSEIKKIILSIKPNAVGCDHTSRCMIKTILDQISPIINTNNI